jgi:hypothetical protein
VTTLPYSELTALLAAVFALGGAFGAIVTVLLTAHSAGARYTTKAAMGGRILEFRRPAAPRTRTT